MKILPAPKIEVTTDYSKFKWTRGNRPISPGHIRECIRELKENNESQYHPITVYGNGDGRYYVADGQHRIEALKHLHLPVYYIVKPGKPSLPEIIRLNNLGKKWSPRDFVDSFCQLGNQNYIKLRTFIQEFKLPVTTAAGILSGLEAAGMAGKAVRDGSFAVRDEVLARRIGNFILAAKQYIPFATDQRFAIALSKLTRVPGFDEQRMIKKLAYQTGKIIKCANWPLYIPMLEEIYNYKVSERQFINLRLEVKKLK
jgi:hypothetical protein